MFGLGGRNVGQMWLRSRSFFTSSLKRGGHDEGHHDIGGIPGNNLPFDINNHYKLALYFGMWFGSGFAMPFIFVRHQLLKKSS